MSPQKTHTRSETYGHTKKCTNPEPCSILICTFTAVARERERERERQRERGRQRKRERGRERETELEEVLLTITGKEHC